MSVPAAQLADVGCGVNSVGEGIGGWYIDGAAEISMPPELWDEFPGQALERRGTGVGANFFTWPEGVVDGRFDRELIALEVGNSVGNLDPVG